MYESFKQALAEYSQNWAKTLPTGEKYLPIYGGGDHPRICCHCGNKNWGECSIGFSLACKEEPRPYEAVVSIWAHGGGYGSVTWCHECVGLNINTLTIEIEDIIRESTPFKPDTPNGIVADWLEEQGRSKSALYMRRRHT